MTELGRKLHTWQEKMERCHAEIERMVYTAELTCDSNKNVEACTKEPCVFNGELGCVLADIRSVIGDHVVQHDIPGVERDVPKGI
jgi:hypothetical protein